jgi:hypothetical protein
MPLTDTVIRKAKPGSKPKRLFDAQGIYLLLNPNGSRYWRFKYRFNGKERLLSLGVYPDVSLKQARSKRDEMRRMLANDVDPSKWRKAQKARSREEPARIQIDHEGSLSIRLDRRRVTLTPDETWELRLFLTATKEVGHGID